MKTAKLFKHGRNQAVRLPESFRFVGNEVFIQKVAEGILLIPKDEDVWAVWERNLMKYDEPFSVERDQPEEQQHREGLDDLFES